jgi:hypothetical protein
MPHITSIERRAYEKGFEEGLREQGEINGLQDGIELVLEVKFGAAGVALMPLVRAVQKRDELRAVLQALRTTESVDQVRDLLSQPQSQ